MIIKFYVSENIYFRISDILIRYAITLASFVHEFVETITIIN